MTKEDENKIKEKIFKITQKFLKNPPLIIWGSGATIPFGLPSMADLNETLKEKIEDFDDENSNLEIEISKEKYKEIMPQIKKAIWDKINDADNFVLQEIIEHNNDDLNSIKLLIEKFIDAHPQVVNIVTTNYDRVLEHLMSYYNIKFTDGFDGKTLSTFEESQFREKNIVNLIKVHGSLNWFDIGGDSRYSSYTLKNDNPKMIAPGKNKYEEAYSSPYRELIQKADNLIKHCSSFLVIGFGFHDDHLTPKIINKINQGISIVLITKKISESSFKALEKAKKYILFEEEDGGKTKVIYKENNFAEKEESILKGSFWKLNKFMEII